jgi:neuromedin U receptor 1
MSFHFPSRVLVKGAWCTLLKEIFPYSFHISIFVFFLIPMSLITVLYLAIGVQLRRSSRKRPQALSTHSSTSTSNVIRMLVAVVV